MRSGMKFFAVIALVFMTFGGFTVAQAQQSHYGGLGVPPVQPAEPETGAGTESVEAAAPASEESVEALGQDGVFTESFDQDFWDRGWESFTLIGNPSLDYTFLGPKRLSFRLPTNEVYEFVVNQRLNAPNGMVEATFENVRSTEASYGVVCRFNALGWYELRATIAGPLAGSYAVYKYDRLLKDSGKVPYVRLHPNMIQYFTGDLKLGLNVRNKLGLSCDGGEIRVFINDKEQQVSLNSPIIDHQFDEGSFGLMVESYGKSVVDIDWVGFTFTDLK